MNKSRLFALVAVVLFVLTNNDGRRPQPTPIPVPDPISVTPVRASEISVLIVTETGDETGISEEARNAIYSGLLREHLNKHCSVDPLTNHREWRILDQDQLRDLKGEKNPKWSEVIEKHEIESLPWIIASDCEKNGKGFIGPCPSKAEEIIALLEKLEGKRK